MEYFQIQGRFGLFEPGHSSSQRVSKNQSSLILWIIVFAHALIILLVLNDKVMPREQVSERFLYMINLMPEQQELISEPHKPEVNELRPLQLKIPSVQIVELVSSPLDIPFNDLSYELPNKKLDRYKDIFDPKLRKKLQDLPARPKVKPKIQYLGVGITLEDIGNGMCLYGDAFQKTGYKVKCGPDQGEQMMLNVEQTLADPLGFK